MAFVSCSWCHTTNEVGPVLTICSKCGHQADVPRIECLCPRCQLCKRCQVLCQQLDASRQDLRRSLRDPNNHDHEILLSLTRDLAKILLEHLQGE